MLVIVRLSVLQVGLTGSQVWWATDVSIAFERVEEGFETALKDYNKKQVMLSLEECIVKCRMTVRCFVQ